MFKALDISHFFDNLSNKTTLTTIMTVFSSAIIWLLGAWNVVLSILATVIVCDYFSGVLCAIKKHELNSTIGWLGLLKKIATVLVVVVAHQLDVALGNTDDIVRNITALFYISNELISIFENVGALGVPLPKILLSICEKLKSEGEKTE